MRMMYDAKHIASHFEPSFYQTTVHPCIKDELERLVPVEERKGEGKYFLFPEESFGASGVIENPDLITVFWGFRSGRRILSRLARVPQVPAAYGLTVVVDWDERRIRTAYPGTASPKELSDPSLSAEEASEALDFWRKHALFADEACNIHPRSPEFEAALASGDAVLLRKLAEEG